MRDGKTVMTVIKLLVKRRH